MSLWLNDEMDGEKQGPTFFGGASTVFRVRKITKIAVPGSVEVLASSAGVALAHADRIGRRIETQDDASSPPPRTSYNRVVPLTSKATSNSGLPVGE